MEGRHGIPGPVLCIWLTSLPWLVLEHRSLEGVCHLAGGRAMPPFLYKVLVHQMLVNG